jgi:hypothetical protein
MEQLRLQFVDEVVRFAQVWFEETAMHYVTKFSEVTLSIGKEKVARMKAKVNELARNAGSVVNRALSDPSVWWHMAPRKHDYYALYEQLGDKFPEVVDKAVRRALGELGTILGEFGFGVSTDGGSKGSYPEFWFEYPEGAGLSDARPFFPHLLVWSEEMQYTIQRYDGLFKRASKVFNELEELKEEKKRQQARELWEST